MFDVDPEHRSGEQRHGALPGSRASSAGEHRRRAVQRWPERAPVPHRQVRWGKTQFHAPQGTEPEDVGLLSPFGHVSQKVPPEAVPGPVLIRPKDPRVGECLGRRGL